MLGIGTQRNAFCIFFWTFYLLFSNCYISRDPSIGAMEPRSSRLKEKKKGEGGQLVKKLFVQNAIQDNELLSCLLNDGSSCIILPINAHDGPVLSALRSRSQLIPKSKLSRCTHDSHNAEGDKADVISAAGLLDQGLLSCVSCGILSFSCVAVIKPRECASKYFMSSDYNSINDQIVGSGGSHLANAAGSEGTNGGILRKLHILQHIASSFYVDLSSLFPDQHGLLYSPSY